MAIGKLGAPIAGRPVLSLGIAAGGIVFALIASNALYGQHGRHPRPIMATRGPVAEGVEVADLSGNETGLMPVPLVLEVQTALNETGHYQAGLDGKPGAATTAAIKSFQSEWGLPVDGQPTPRLLQAIRKAATKAQEPVRVASGGPVGAEVQDDRTGSVPSIPKADLVKRIQSGLAAAEVAKLKPDGVAGEQTRAAIRTFEALEGLDVTGEPNERILKRLIEIGALH
ncbi:MULTISPECIES: peptidoglycan-binding protein [unclassified Aureimonas]|uniref:peptidoglycan-binding domain-containing protein n=1 Tax=unclassified Aureimonas TaxID=2615206 RepID=UPI0006F70D3D|nr:MULTISPECIES: peptidoglycan-binding protein [unclassified Aureimonas]KQT55257.1 hypothetical protein ASG62_10505 [Aureimonas sp. Leaf427]KQT71048.1 hypothetical protein ASG54_20890 [Aureimonas sp. Leaf460]